jgi:hypothetical protein
MSFHPAYPTASQISAEANAIQRDLADQATLRELRRIVSGALDRASRCDAIQHPDRRFQVGDLTETLQGLLTDIDGEAERIKRGPVVIEEAE